MTRPAAPAASTGNTRGTAPGAAERIVQALAAADTELTATELADRLGLSLSAVTKALAKLHTAGRVVRHSGSGGGKRPTARWGAPPAPPGAGAETTPRAARVTRTSDARGAAQSGTATTPSPAPGRLGKGELGGLVLAHLRAQPAGTVLTPGQIARALARSAGAVANACDRLTATGQASQVGEKPRTFTAAPTAPNAGPARPTRQSARRPR